MIPYYLFLALIICRLVKGLINWWKKQKKEEKEEVYSRWERDNILLPVEEQGLFSEYLELGNNFCLTSVFCCQTKR